MGTFDINERMGVPSIPRAKLAKLLTEASKPFGLEGQLHDRLEDLLITVFGEPNDPGNTDEWRFGTKGSLSVGLSGDKRGLWKSFEDDDACGRDVLGLLAWSWSLTDRADVEERAEATLNDLAARSHIAANAGGATDDIKWSSDEAVEKYWGQADKLSDDHGRAYLLSRGIDPDRVTMSIAREVQHKANKKEDTNSFPAVVFRLTDADDNATAIHAVRCPRGEKLTNAAKITNGTVKGAAIKFPGVRTADGEIVLVEGPEDALSIWQETGIETWATCSISNLGAAPVRLGQRFVVIGDADSKTEELTRAACAELSGRCSSVRLAFPGDGHKDPNAVLKADPDGAAKIFTDLIEAGERIEGGSIPTLETGMIAAFDPVAVDANFDPKEIPQRAWQVPGLTMLGHMTVIVSPGAVGKSSFGIAASVAVALGRDDMIPGYDRVKQGNVLLVNGEDDQHELDRRLAGVLQEYGIEPGELAGRLFLQSFYGSTPRLAEYDKREDKVRPGPLFQELIAFCLEHDIRLIIIDPLIGFHGAPENMNEAMEQVSAILRAVAHETGAALMVMHHTRKTGGNSEAHAGDQESGRGASALIWAARIAKTLARMAKDTAKQRKLDWGVGLDLRRIDDAKANYARANEDAVWFRMKSTRIANDETVPVPVAFDMSKLAAELEVDKEEAGKKALENQLNEVGETLAKKTNAGHGKQTDIGAELQTLLGIGRSTAQDRLRTVPVGEADAHGFYHLGHKYLLWRENTGTDHAPRFSIYWGPKSKRPTQKPKGGGRS
jgi:RecA-family ATPase